MVWSTSIKGHLPLKNLKAFKPGLNSPKKK